MKKINENFEPQGKYKVTCIDPKGNLKWQEKFVDADNTVVDVGIQHILDVLFVSATTQIDPWYTGLTTSTPTPSANDTISSHPGWTEFTDYDETTRQEFTDARTDLQVDNSGNEATFTISTNSSTIGGAFLVSDNTKGGSTGTLLSVAAFNLGDKSADAGDTLKVEYQFSGSSA